jgi:pimeloyl-ACP methyl ester carboxylesterase
MKIQQECRYRPSSRLQRATLLVRPHTSGVPLYDLRRRTGPVRVPTCSSRGCRAHAALDWFTGLSSKFLAARTARLLVLAGTDRLDKELMIGQMQGKYQLVVVPGVGHMLHEVCVSQQGFLLSVTDLFFFRRLRTILESLQKLSSSFGGGTNVCSTA